MCDTYFPSSACGEVLDNNWPQFLDIVEHLIDIATTLIQDFLSGVAWRGSSRSIPVSPLSDLQGFLFSPILMCSVCVTSAMIFVLWFSSLPCTPPHCDLRSIRCYRGRWSAWGLAGANAASRSLLFTGSLSIPIQSLRYIVYLTSVNLLYSAHHTPQ